MSAHVLIVCATTKGRGRPHWRKLAVWPVGQRLQPEAAPGRAGDNLLAAQDGHIDPVRGVPQFTSYTFRCPEHGHATVSAVDLLAAYQQAERSGRRVDVRLTPMKHREE